MGNATMREDTCESACERHGRAFARLSLWKGFESSSHRGRHVEQLAVVLEMRTLRLQRQMR